MPDNWSDKPMLMDVKEASEELGVSTDTIYRYAEDRRNGFPSIHIGKRVMIPRTEFYKWKEQNKK